jgi:ferredoxin
MCIISPKLVEVGRHLNIELLDCAEVVGLTGEPGNFTLSVRQRPRFVDRTKCTGCGDCVVACPITLPDSFNGGLSTRKAIYKLYPQAIPNAYSISAASLLPGRLPGHQRPRLHCPVPVGLQMPIAPSWRITPSLGCGRVCNHRCEQACSRAQLTSGKLDGLKRFIADWARTIPSR